MTCTPTKPKDGSSNVVGAFACLAFFGAILVCIGLGFAFGAAIGFVASAIGFVASGVLCLAIGVPVVIKS